MRRHFNGAFMALALVLGAYGCNCGHVGAVGGPDGGQLLPDGGYLAYCPAGLTAVSVAPTNSTVTLTGATPSPVQFTATGTVSGKSTDLTKSLTWSVSRQDDTPPGSISGGLYQPTGAGGVVTVTAACVGVSGQTTVTLILNASFNTTADGGTVDTTPFNGPVVTGNATRSPLVVYPSDQTRFPRNVYKVLFQWDRSSNSTFRLTFHGPYSTTQVYTDGNDPQCATAANAACWQSDETSWLAIAGSNAGQVTTLTIDGVAPADSNVYEAPSISLGFSLRDVVGAIFYWSTTSQGVRRATVSDAIPEEYVVAKPTATVLPDAGTVQCVACHTVSRDGRKMVASTQTNTLNNLLAYDVTLMAPPQPLFKAGTVQRGFGTFSPDDSRLVTTTGGPLAEWDGTTGALITNLPTGAATQPDWSPLGAELVYANQAGDAPAKASLDVIAYNAADGGWGAIRTLVPMTDGGTAIYPSYSPEGTYVAYSVGKGGHGDVTLQLHATRADGTGQDIELVNANRVVSNHMTTGQYENAQPTWAPPGDLHWIAFNSLRPYGVIYPNGGTQQIWVAAVDFNKLDGGADISYPAFRFAFQLVNENNHRAFWAQDIRVVPDGGGSTFNEDGGTCLSANASCSQTTGSSCCPGSVCDSPDGGASTYCVPTSTCPGAGQACTAGGTACCPGYTCENGSFAVCDGGSPCTCQPTIG